MDTYSKEVPAFNTCVLGGIVFMMPKAACDTGMQEPSFKQFKRLSYPPRSLNARKNPDMGKNRQVT